MVIDGDESAERWVNLEDIFIWGIEGRRNERLGCLRTVLDVRGRWVNTDGDVSRDSWSATGCSHANRKRWIHSRSSLIAVLSACWRFVCQLKSFYKREIKKSVIQRWGHVISLQSHRRSIGTDDVCSYRSEANEMRFLGDILSELIRINCSTEEEGEERLTSMENCRSRR